MQAPQPYRDLESRRPRRITGILCLLLLWGGTLGSVAWAQPSEPRQPRCFADILGPQASRALSDIMIEIILDGTARMESDEDAQGRGDYTFADFDTDANGTFNERDLFLLLRRSLYDTLDVDGDTLLSFYELECAQAWVAAGQPAGLYLSETLAETEMGTPDQEVDCDGDGLGNRAELNQGRDPLRPGVASGVCRCEADYQCFANQQCRQNRCVQCPMGSETCACRPAQAVGGPCDGELDCEDGLCVGACLEGTVNCPCRNDGNPCEGDLLCLAGQCRPPSCQSTLTCAADPATVGTLCLDARCTACTSDEQCVRSGAYGPESTCVQGLCQNGVAPCVPGAPSCACGTAVDCQPNINTRGMICIESQCIACRADSHCSRVDLYGYGARCQAGRCTPWQSPCADDPAIPAGRCECAFGNECNGDDLTRGMTCLDGQCLPCLSDAMCERSVLYGEGTRCIEGRCVPPQACDPRVEVCQCITANDCAREPVTDGRLCLDGACVACRDDSNCERAAAYGAGSTCVAGRCQRPAVCPPGLNCNCRSAAQCDANPVTAGQICLDGRCTPCESDSFCARISLYGEGSRCEAGRCVND